MKSVAKLIVALGGAGLIAAQTALSDGGITPSEWVTVGIALTTSVGVWAASNEEPLKEARPQADYDPKH